MEQTKDIKNVFVIAHSGSVKALKKWIQNRKFNHFNLYEDRNKQKFIGLQFIHSASQRDKRGVIVFKVEHFIPDVEKVLNEFIYGVAEEKR